MGPGMPLGSPRCGLPRSGEVILAHHGVLFSDDMPRDSSAAPHGAYWDPMRAPATRITRILSPPWALARCPPVSLTFGSLDLVHTAGIGANNISGCFCVMEDNQPWQNGPLVYLSVEGRLDTAVEAAIASGGRVLQQKHPIGPCGFRAPIVDSEGNRTTRVTVVCGDMQGQ